MNTLYNSHGKVNWFGWIMFFGTLIVIGYTIYQFCINYKKNRRDEEAQMKKLTELEMNLREVRGEQYKSLNLNNNNNNNNNQTTNKL